MGKDCFRSSGLLVLASCQTSATDAVTSIESGCSPFPSRAIAAAHEGPSPPSFVRPGSPCLSGWQRKRRERRNRLAPLLRPAGREASPLTISGHVTKGRRKILARVNTNVTCACSKEQVILRVFGCGTSR